MNLYAIQKVTADALQVNNNSQLKGIAVFGNKITIDGANSSISSSAAALNFGSNNLQTSGNISGNSNEVLYGNGVWKTLPLQSPWIADNNGVYPDTLLPNRNVIVPVLYADKIFAQSSVSIGNFKFSNGGVQPAPPVVKDTISTPNKLAVSAGKEISLLSDTVKVGTPATTVRLDVNGSVRVRDYLWVEQGLLIGKLFRGDKGEFDTLAPKTPGAYEIYLPYARAQKITSDTIVTAKLETDSITAIKLASDTLVAKEVRADTVTAQKVETEKISADKEARINNVVIDGLNNKIYSTSGVLDFGGNNFNDVGTITADNMNVSFTEFDSLRVADTLWIGPNSLSIAGGAPGGNDNILSTNGRIIFGRYGFLNQSNINIGIGSFSTTNPPQHKIHIHDHNPLYVAWHPPDPPPQLPQPRAVNMAFTNWAQAGGTGIGANDGFQIGIAGEGSAELNQKENKPIIFYTGDYNSGDNLERMRITETGNVEINGTFQYQDGNQQAGYILTSDPDGLAHWSPPVAVVSDGDWYFSGNDIINANITGKVIVGTQKLQSTSPHYSDYLMSVSGKLVAQKLISTEQNWADDEWTKELTLEDFEKEMEFALKNSHFKDIPSGSEIDKNGIDLGEMSALQMRKIEQIYMYLFLLKKENGDLKKEIEILKANGK